MIEAVIPRQAIGSPRAEAPKTSEARGTMTTLKEKGKALLDKVKNWLPFWKKQAIDQPQDVVAEIADVENLADSPQASLVSNNVSIAEAKDTNATDEQFNMEGTSEAKKKAEADLTADSSEPLTAEVVYDEGGSKKVEASTPLTRAIEGLPKNEQVAIITGHHGKSEPIAEIVGKRLGILKKGEGHQVDQVMFEQGYDYQDALEKAKAGVGSVSIKDRFKKVNEELEKQGVKEMSAIAARHPDQVVVSFHETRSPWDLKDSMIVGILLPPRLTPKEQTDMKEFLSLLNERFQAQQIPLFFEAQSMASLEGPRVHAKKYNEVPPNLFVVEIHTSENLYDITDPNIHTTEGNTRLKTDPDTEQKVVEVSDRYVNALNETLPVLTARYQTYLRPEYDMRSHVPDY